MAEKHQKGAKSPPQSGNVIIFSGRYRLRCDKRLPDLDSPQAEAYETVDSQRPDNPVFMLLCRPDTVPRPDLVTRLLGLKRDGMMLPLTSGVVDWPATGNRRLAVILSRPDGRRLVPLGAFPTSALAARDIVRQILRPLAPALFELSERAVPHRAIRADNLFFRDEGEGEAQLGECISAPAGFDQPVLYESVQTAMSDPEGRGYGCLSDDYYALGVTMALFFLGRNPCAALSDAEIIACKLRRGSFATLLSDLSVPIELAEPLHGLLCDDLKQRWGRADLESWIGGRRLSPKGAGLPPKAARPFAFKDIEYTDARSLAHAMAQDWPAAIKVVNQGKILDWIDRVLLNPPADSQGTGHTKQAAVPKFAPSGESEDIRLAQVLIKLDPLAPIRFKNMALHVEGLGPALAFALHNSDRVRLLTTLLRSGLVDDWLDAQESSRPEHLALRHETEQATAYLSNSRLGFGQERTLYRLNPDCPCKSSYFNEDYVASLKELLGALERLAKQGTAARDPLDRHSAAFCLARAERLPEQAMRDLGAKTGSTRILGMLRILASIQANVGPSSLPALARWFEQLCAVKIDEFHSRELRRELKQNLALLTGKGSLTKMASLFEDQSLMKRDDEAFNEARIVYQQTGRQIEWLEQGGISGRDNIARSSRQAAGLVSAMLSGLMLVAMTLVYML